MDIYIARDEKTFGPYTFEQFQKHIKDGRIGPRDKVWVQAGWYLASDLPCIFAEFCKSLSPRPAKGDARGTAKKR